MSTAGSNSTTAAHTAIIDIGSNSVRLVVYGGPPRLPSVLFNEKVLAGLGRSLSHTGAIDAQAMAAAQVAIRRFAWLTREMKVPEVRTVATAAVRDASNGAELVASAEAEGLHVELLPGEAEATGSGYGVLSAFPEADGIVGDLGGGSLELVRVTRGTLGARVSFPLGVLRIAAIREKGRGALDRHVAEALREAGWTGAGQGLDFYLVGGSWRGLTQLDMHLTRYPLPIVHGYAMTSQRVHGLSGIVHRMSRAELKAVPDLSGGRTPTLSDATALLVSVLGALDCERTVTSAFGLREGLLFQSLPPAARAEDPLLAAARDEGVRMCRFVEHGDLLHDWIAPLFAGEDRESERLRHAACLLADVGWHANPQFRAERGVEVALHGQWVAIDAAGRAVLAQALHTSLGGGVTTPVPLEQLAPAARLQQATRWGLAMRLGQRLSGGVAAPLRRTKIARDQGVLRLSFPTEDRRLYGDAVEKRHRALAAALNLQAVTSGT